MRINRTKYFALLLLTIGTIAGKAQPLIAPLGSYTSDFRYYDPTDPLLPAGSSDVSKGVAYLFGYPRDQEQLSVANGTAFIIQTFRNDDTLCVCTAGHVARSLFGEQSSNARFDLSLRYLGRPKTSDPTLNELVSCFETPTRIGARLVKQLESADEFERPDIALFLIDKKQLPAVADYAMIGYDLSTFSSNPANPSARFYQIGHPNAMPQRITTSFQLAVGDITGVLESSGSIPAPVGLGPAASGSPLIMRTLPDGTVSSTGTARAVLHGGDSDPVHPIPRDGNLYFPIERGTDLVATELATIAADIKAHCWKAKTEAELEQTKEYMRTVIANNNIQPFSTAQTLNQAMDLLSIAAPNCYTVNTASDHNTPVNATYLKAATCLIGSLTFPTTYTATNKPWQINIEGKEVNITPNTSNAFSYDAAANAELNLASVIVQTSSAVARIRSDDNNETDDGNPQNSLPGNFIVKPNPSTTGHFSIDIPAASDHQEQTYDIIVSELSSGKTIKKESAHAGTTWQADLANFARGAYLVAFYQKGMQPHFVKLIYR